MSEDTSLDPVVAEAIEQLQNEIDDQFSELRREPWIPQLEKKGGGTDPIMGSYHTITGKEEDQMKTDDWVYYTTGKVEGMEKALYILYEEIDELG